MRPETTASNAKELKFGRLDSSYRVGTAKAEGVGRSDTIQLFHGSEVAHWPNAEKHTAGALQAVPDAPGTEIWLESTANGAAGLFYNMCVKAERGEGEYELIFIPWFDHDEYRKTPPKDWRPSPAWGEYAALHGLAPDQLYWGWTKNAEFAGSTGGELDDVIWLFRQEYPATAGDAFQSSGADSFIRSEGVIAARAADFPDTDFAAPLIFGVDIAHGGADKTRIVDRCGRRMAHLVNETMDEADEMVIGGTLARLIDRFGPDMVFVDITGGYGAGVVDRLRERGYAMVRGINFGAKADASDTYANKRAEMWGRLKDWFAAGADMADDGDLARDIAAPTAKPDSSGRLVLEKKDDIRKRLGLSPDGGDAATLTFAENVRRKGAGGKAPQAADADYDMMGF